MKKIIIYGGTSKIALEFLHEYINKTSKIIIFVRNKKKFLNLIEKSSDIIISQKEKIKIFEEDILDLKNNFLTIKKLKDFEYDGLLFVVGSTGNPDKEFTNNNLLFKNFKVNLLHPIWVINLLTRKLKNNSFICVITSVAGIRGRNLRLFYCSAKSGLISYLSGLRQRLSNRNILVQNFIAGYISTEKFNYKAPKILVSTPHQIAKKIINSISKKKMNVYSSYYWYLISIIIRLIPEFIFKKLKF